MSKPVDVLAVMAQLEQLAADDCPPEARDTDSSEYDEWERACCVLAEARQARATVAELIEALRLSDEWIKEAVIRGASQPSTATLFRNQAVLAKVTP
jgi:hypothetical protein